MKETILLLTTICLLASSTSAQKRRTRIIPCRVVEVMQVGPPEAQLAISDTVLIISECKDDRKLYTPSHQWPEGLSSDVGTKLQLVVDKNGESIGLKVGKQVVRVQTSIPRHLL